MILTFSHIFKIIICHLWFMIQIEKDDKGR